MTDILEAIKAICDDIRESRDAEDNHKRAEAILGLSFAYMLLPDDQEENLKEAGAEAGQSAAMPGA